MYFHPPYLAQPLPYHYPLYQHYPAPYAWYYPDPFAQPAPPPPPSYPVIHLRPQTNQSQSQSQSQALPRRPSTVSAPSTDSEPPIRPAPDPPPRDPADHRQPVQRSYHPNLPPNRSEWVMWVGNVPSDASHDELWRLLTTTPDDSGVLSVFLISRSNCAFVNYQSEQHLARAIAHFNGRQFRQTDRRCPRLVCRARRKEDDLRAGVGAQRGIGVHTQYVKNTLQRGKEAEKTEPSRHRRSHSSTTSSDPQRSRDDETTRSEIVQGATTLKDPTRSSSSHASTSSSFLVRHFPKRFFILKSLTQYDLDLSVERGLWATQKHNEDTLDQAFRTSDDVVLIFSVNKSGEFYGYARMGSGILRSNCNVSWAPRADRSRSTSSPSSSSVPAHDTPEQAESGSYQHPQAHTLHTERRSLEAPLAAPHSDRPLSLRPEPGKVRERARRKSSGADDPGNLGIPLQSVEEEVPRGDAVARHMGSSGPLQFPDESEMHHEQREPSWGETFKVEWMCVERIPFHRTRHLRNPWNHGREIKVSRDGTELEPVVGQRLVDEWRMLAAGGGSAGDGGGGDSGGGRRGAGLGGKGRGARAGATG